ncbi:MAG: tRNA (adenosine(37)-N6)-threonylcarbamoyltransferase complex dimerization subunit type 1 TsaB [Lachnospiraceae bacterium]|nr:tRNA (adenosine(37)-N6)-threonylcarbamoyltransferase complex dimerization subunit type 1 TsaB [Lachnospiraceae bacterium]
MKLLAMDSSGLVATVAVMEDDIMRAEYTVNYKKTHSQTLLPMIDEIAAMIELDLNTVDAIAVAGGPGSFTGLRIGSATAKGLGLALDKPIISVPTVVGLAYNYYGSNQLICPIMDARRNQVYTGVYSFQDGTLHTYMEQCAISIDELIDRLAGIVTAANSKSQSPQEVYGDTMVIFLGDGVPVQKEYIDAHAEFRRTYAPAHMNGQRAGALGICAMQMWQRQSITPEGPAMDSMKTIDSESGGRIETAAEHHPDYLRLSQAERERAEREKQGIVKSI